MNIRDSCDFATDRTGWRFRIGMCQLRFNRQMCYSSLSIERAYSAFWAHHKESRSRKSKLTRKADMMSAATKSKNVCESRFAFAYSWRRRGFSLRFYRFMIVLHWDVGRPAVIFEWLSRGYAWGKPPLWRDFFRDMKRAQASRKEWDAGQRIQKERMQQREIERQKDDIQRAAVTAVAESRALQKLISARAVAAKAEA